MTVLGWQPSRGERVRVRYTRALTYGVVRAAGPEQSEVVLDGERAPRVYVNSDLVPVRAAPRERKRLRERRRLPDDYEEAEPGA